MREDAQQQATEFLKDLYAAGDIDESGFDAGMTGLLSGFGLESISNSGGTIARLVHGLHEGLEAIVKASTDEVQPGHHQMLELMVLRGIWMAIAVVLLALFVKWGRSAETGAAVPAPALVAVPAEIPRAQAA